ncbi:MAG: AAA family ATPase [Myxococcales bacterium]|nr:AAA family ATPase [Myxococcales bacterium]
MQIGDLDDIVLGQAIRPPSTPASDDRRIIQAGPPPQAFPANPRFIFRRLLGQGGLGVVFLTYDRERQEEVALKLVTGFGADAGFHTRGEFRVLADVHHPNLARVLDLFVDEFGTYFTMEYVEGGTFDAWIRGEFGLGTGRFDRLLHGARSLCRALDFLHGEGMAHGDVKPSNVLVTHDGRLKLVDFGLVRELDGLVRRVNPNAGTPLYLPPEAFFGNTDVQAWDWYAAAVTLFEATLGRLPFPDLRDDPLGLAVAKTEAPDPHHFPRPREVPGWFIDLLFSLLAPTVGDRPEPATVLQRLGEPIRQGQAFVGRRNELSLLVDQVERVRDHGAAIVEVTGPSGIGKTSLVERFLRDVRHETAVLPVRCRENERVPFNALDAAVDALSRTLKEAGPGLGEDVVPRDADALLALFPVLGVVPALAKAAAARPMPAGMEPRERRERGAVALRQVLEGLSRRQPVVLWIDDAQWADRDSLWLLEELLRPPRMPALLLVLCVRDDARDHWTASARDLRAMPLPWYQLDVHPLGAGDATRLAMSLLGPKAEDLARSLAAESGGNPFFIQWLSRTSRDGSVPAGLGDAVAQHVAGLLPDERRCLALCALAAGALPVEVLLHAAALSQGGASTLDALVLARLLRRRRAPARLDGDREHLVVEVIHAQVTRGVLTSVPASRRPRLHGDLADALRAFGGPPDQIVDHLIGAGRVAEAAGEAWQAARQAEAGLAFDAAARFYAQAAELGAEAPAWELYEAQASCLVHAGQLRAAGEAYENAARLVEPDDPVRALDLGRRAAEQYLHCGQVSRGKELFEAVLQALEVEPVRTARAADKYSSLLRFRLGFSGYRVRAGAAPDRRQRVRLDALWGATTSLALVNHQLADAYGVLHLSEALQLDDAERIVRALGYEAAFLAGVEHWLLPAGRGERLIRRVMALANDQATPYSLAWARMSAGAAAWHQARWRDCVQECERAERIYAAECRGVDWERAVTAVHRLYALAQLGELETLAADVPDGLRRALIHGDHFAANHHRQGPACLRWLAADRPERARQDLAQAAATWQDHDDLFSTQHYHHLLAATQVDLYEGHADAAFDRVETAWPRVEQARFLMLGYCGAELWHLRGRAAAAILATPDVDPAVALRARRVLKLADKALRRGRVAVATPFADLLAAAVAWLDGDRERVRARLLAAVVRFEELDMALHVECARLCLGVLRLETGPAEAALTARGVRSARRMAAVLVPGLVVPG